MQVTYITGRFPEWSETFLVNQIAGIKRLGCEVRIHAMPLEATARRCCHAGVAELEQHVSYRPAPSEQTIKRWLASLELLGIYPRRWAKLIKVYREGMKDATARSFSYLALGRSLLDAPPPEIIHAQFGMLGRQVERLQSAGIAAAPLITSIRGGDVNIILRRDPSSYRYLYQYGRRFLPVCSFLAKRLIANGCPPEKIEVHHSGIALSAFRFRLPDPPRDRVARLVTVARLAEMKGVEYGIRAVNELIKAGRRVNYTVIGDGPLRQSLQSLIKQLDLAGVVELLGMQPAEKVQALLPSFDIMLVPSVVLADGDEEGLPNTAKEALATGLLLIGTRTGGIPDLIDDGVTGWLVPERNTRELAGRISWVLEHPGMWIPMAKAGRKKIQDEFDINQLNLRLHNIYSEAIDSLNAIFLASSKE